MKNTDIKEAHNTEYSLPQITITMHTPEIEISNNAKICYATSGDKDITTQLVHGHGHLAALRFAYATIKVENISIACQNQVVRSKHLDFMVESKRYVSLKKGEFKFIMPKNLSKEAEIKIKNHWEKSIELYKDLILENKLTKEDARSILPANTSTNMNITGSLQSWWDFFKLRMNKHSQLEIRTLAIIIYDELSIIYPKVFTSEVKESMLNKK